MRSSHAHFATTIIAGLLIAASCTSTAAPAPDVTPTASPPIAVLPTPGASPTTTTTPASPSPSATPEPTPEPTPVVVPPKPTGVSFDEQVHRIGDSPEGEITQTVTWRAPRSEGVEIRVYGVTDCIAEPANPAPGTSGPCLVVHTPVPASVRTLLATAPAPGGLVSWTWTQVVYDCGGPPVAYDPSGPVYYAVVLAAYSAAGHSIFAIAEPGEWWRAAEGPGDIIC